MGKPKVAVAGAAGFIGSHVVERLRAAGHPVLALDRQGADLSLCAAAGAETLEINLGPSAGQTNLGPSGGETASPVRTSANLVRALEGCTALVNAVGLFDLGASREALRAANVDAVDHLLAAAQGAGVRRVVHLSSVAVYGRPNARPMPEDGRLAPLNDYEHSKLAGEQRAMSYHGQGGLEVAVLRPTLVYGPRSRYGQGLLVALVAQLRALGRRRFPTLLGGPLGHHVHVEDVAGATELLLFHEGAAGRAYNVADKAPLGLGDSIAAIVRALDLEVSLGWKSRFLWAIVRMVMQALPGPLVRLLDRRIQRGHRAVLARGGSSALRPRLDPDWLGYFAGAYVFDTSRLESLGFTHAHPDFAAAIPRVVAWYERAGWIAPGRLPRPDTPRAALREKTP